MGHFQNLFVFGRPAGGKSEFIDFIKKCEPQKLLQQFHIGPFEIIDDFHFLWEVGENESIFENLSEKPSSPRRFTEMTDDGVVVTDGAFFDFVSEKINRVFGRKNHSDTTLIEFSRGTGEVGYRRALSLLKEEILQPAAILYIKVSYQEALRRNEARYQDKLKHSILAHKVPERAMERFYQQDDWETLTKGEQAGFLKLNSANIPFVTMENEPESKNPQVMEKRYQEALDLLWKKRKEKE